MICGVAAASLLASTPVVSQAGDLKLRFEYAGAAEEPSALVVNKDVEFCGKHQIFNERLLVNKENKGIKDVVVYVYTGRGGSKLDDVPAKNNTHELENNACRFEPHIVICQTGDTLKVTNPDAVGHNANLPFFKNPAQNFLIPPGQEKSVVLEDTEPAPIPVECNIHPWMRAYVVVLEHPYVAKSDENGDLVIKDLPEGEELTFRVFHEAGKIDDVTIDGKAEKWSRSRFEVTIEPGVNDLGTVVVPADALSAE
ncbi:methylamine utilization protein [Novipirellula caenicola]|uniref:Methylamine utilization protein n=1 Tax=Novipirellula caenicola TaxID=1536901 RepID=A0ABP9VPI0_9BACT